MYLAHLITKVVAGGDLHQLLQHKVPLHLPEGGQLVVGVILALLHQLPRHELTHVLAELAQIGQEQVQLLVSSLLPRMVRLG